MDLISCLRMTIGLNPDHGTEGRSEVQAKHINNTTYEEGGDSVTFYERHDDLNKSFSTMLL